MRVAHLNARDARIGHLVQNGRAIADRCFDSKVRAALDTLMPPIGVILVSFNVDVARLVRGESCNGDANRIRCAATAENV